MYYLVYALSYETNSMFKKRMRAEFLRILPVEKRMQNLTA